MKTKLAIITHLNKIIPNIINQISLDLNDNKTKITGIISYKLMKIQKVVIEEYNLFEKCRNDIIMKYGKEIKENSDEKRKEYKVTPDNMLEYQKELNILANNEIEINVPEIRLSELNLDTINLHPTDLFMMLNSNIFIDDIATKMIKEEIKEEVKEKPNRIKEEIKEKVVEP